MLETFLDFNRNPRDYRAKFPPELNQRIMVKWRTGLAANNKIVKDTLTQIKPGLSEETTKLLMEAVSMNLDTKNRIAKIINGYEKEVYNDTLEFWQQYDFSTLKTIGPQEISQEELERVKVPPIQFTCEKSSTGEQQIPTEPFTFSEQVNLGEQVQPEDQV